MAIAETRKPTVVVAGPGAGKTHNMVSNIANRIPDLASNRYLVAITYTNAAADLIRERLYRQTKPSRNVYIGTIHSFLNRFVLSPFAVVTEELPDEHIFLSVDATIPAQTSSGKKRTQQEIRMAKASKIKALVKRGVVPYDRMGSVAATLIKQKEIRRLVGHRIQYLFVDEFQDVDTTQYAIFDELRKEKKTTIFVVGDPEQYISTFTYRNRSLAVKAPDYAKIPFFRFAEKSDRIELEDNHRSCDELVNFTNQFHGQLSQDGRRGQSGGERVAFLEDCKLDEIVGRFRSITSSWHTGSQPITRLYLSHFNKTLEPARQRFGLVPVSNTGAAQSSLLQEACELLAKAMGKNQNRIRREHDLDLLMWRKIGIRLLKGIRKGEIDSTESLDVFLTRECPLVERSKEQPVSYELQVLIDCVINGSTQSDCECVSSIHKAKGLEADAVLVVAKNQAELRKWCETETSVRSADKDDICRIGFVAFSRAKESLVLACLKKIDNETKAVLESLGIALM